MPLFGWWVFPSIIRSMPTIIPFWLISTNIFLLHELPVSFWICWQLSRPHFLPSLATSVFFLQPQHHHFGLRPRQTTARFAWWELLGDWRCATRRPASRLDQVIRLFIKYDSVVGSETKLARIGSTVSITITLEVYQDKCGSRGLPK